jgi:hypothetical protein
VIESHPIKQPIQSIAFHIGNTDAAVGRYGVTRIEACEKGGEHCMIPYVRVWKGDVCWMEIPQHKLSYGQFAPPETAT